MVGEAIALIVTVYWDNGDGRFFPVLFVTKNNCLLLLQQVLRSTYNCANILAQQIYFFSE